MPRSLSGIYGADDNGLAERVSGEALGSGVGDADYWGGIEGDGSEQSMGNVGNEPTDDFKILSGRANAATSNKGRGDTEPILTKYPNIGKSNRHIPGPSNSSDEGGGAKSGSVPRNQMATRRGGSPKP